MMKRLTILFLILIPFFGVGQSNVVENTDSILYYQEDEQYYFLNLIGDSRTIYFDSQKYDNSRPIHILIRNNTADTITISYKSLMSSKVDFKENSSRFIKPNEYYSISPIFNKERYAESSLLSAHFAFNYSIHSEPIQVFVLLKGYIVLDSLPEFVKEEHSNFILASTPVPELIASEQKQTMVEPKVVADTEAVALSEPHYYNFAGERVAVNKAFVGSYYIPRDYSNNDYSQRRIDSLNSLLKNYKAFLKYGLDGGFILKCNQKQTADIKRKLGNQDMHQLIEEERWVTDRYDLFFDPKLTEESIKAILERNGITDFVVKFTEAGSNEGTKSFYKVSIKLDNIPWSNANNLLLNEMLGQEGILKIVQESIHFSNTND